MSAQYPIRAVSKLTGIALDTLRAWERRYGAVTPARSDRGRLYRDADVLRLQLLRTAVEAGHAIGQVASLTDDELRALAPRPAPVAAAPAEIGAILAAIEAFDADAANQELGRLALLMRPTELVHKLVVPLMHTAGQNWESGKFHIAHEHLLSACVRSLLGGMVRMQAPLPGAARLLFTTPAAELHEFGILAAAMLAVAHRFPMVYLGPNLPSSEIVYAAEHSATQVVVLGIVAINATPAVHAEVQRMATDLPPQIELWAGGTGAATVLDATVRPKTFLLDDLGAFDQHLARMRLR